MHYQKSILFAAAISLSLLISAQTGPGGIGTTDGSSSLKMWFRIDSGITGTTNASAWTNSAGESNHNLSATGSQQPTINTNAVNGYDDLSFDGGDYMEITGSLSTTNFVNDEASTFLVGKVNTTTASWVYATYPHQTNRFSCHVTWNNNDVYFDIGNCCGSSARMQVSGLTGLTNYSYWSYDAENSAGKQLYRNGSLLQSRANTLTYSSHATQSFRIGESYNGTLTEMILFNQKINSAERIIIENYLAAKYGITSAANDIYTMDDVGNGNYDHDVAGIGRVDASNLHTDSRGTGIVQVTKSGGGLGNNEFLFWGHDNGYLGSYGGTDVPGGVDARLIRTWRVSEQGEPGSVLISFDLTGLGPVTASELRLLIDSDADGDFSNAAVISGATDLGGNVYQFNTSTNNTLEDGDTFTLATTDANSTPLPIQLLNFEALPKGNLVNLNWTTATEINNDFFTIERSADAENWEGIKRIEGGGNSKDQISYSAIDVNPIIGDSYYRLKQTDFDGNFTYSDIEAVHVKPASRLTNLEIYPNPSDGNVVVRFNSTVMSDRAIIHVFNAVGFQVYSNQISIIQGENKVELDINNAFPGYYIVQILNESSGESIQKSIVIK